MNKYFLRLIILLSISCSDKNKEDRVYIYDSEQVMKINEMNSMTSYSINIPVYTSWNDTIKFEISSKGYILLHFSESDGINRADTTFLKYKTFLDSIEFLNSDWLKQEKNLIEFWDKSLYENGGHLDTLKIFIIQPIKGTDSLRIEQVHRFFMPNREG